MADRKPTLKSIYTTLMAIEHELGLRILDALDAAEDERDAEIPEDERRPIYTEDVCPELDNARFAIDEAIINLRDIVR